MDKVFSARLDERAIQEMTRVAKRLGMTKKEFLESAIRLRAQHLDAQTGGQLHTLNVEHYPMPELSVKRAWS